MYKLFDWKTVLFWHTYYGYWIYLRVKNGRPGEIVMEEDDVAILAIDTNKTSLSNNKTVEEKGTVESAKPMVENILSMNQSKVIELTAENQHESLVIAVPTAESEQVEQLVEPVVIEEFEELCSVPTDLKSLLQKVSYDIEEVLKNV